MTGTILTTIAATSARADATLPPEEDASVTVAGVEIVCRLTRPAGIVRGAVLLLPGSLYSDIDGNYPSMNLHPHAYADLAHQLGWRGFVVLRMAKIGPGTGSRTFDPASAGRHSQFVTRVDVAAAGLALLRTKTDARPLMVAGHSEGAVVASLLASGKDAAAIDGVVSLSGPALPILDILREQIAGMAPPGQAADLYDFDHLVIEIRAGRPVPEQARSNPLTAMLASMPPPAIDYLVSADRVDPMLVIAEVRQPVLIVQGGRDASVPAAHADRLKDVRKDLPTQTAFFPTLTHFYKTAPEGLPPMQSMSLTTDSDPAVADAMLAWSRDLRR
jgi:pimeloyl-ACP methyl ester carboxylesterase